MTNQELRFIGVETDDGGHTLVIQAATSGGSVRNVRLTDAQAMVVIAKLAQKLSVRSELWRAS
jgi:hypothetical protein